MASIRRFKGDVDFLLSEVISDCCTCIAINKVDKDKVFAIMSEAFMLREELYERINNPEDKHNAKAVKKYYIELRKEMISKVEDYFGRLSDCFNAQ